MMTYKRNLKSRLRNSVTTAVTWALFSALVGVPILLDVWQLAVYPAVIGGLVLFWMYLEHRAKTDPAHPLGFLDHKHAMQFGFLFGIPALLFLAAWTFGLAFSGNPVLKKAGLIIGALMVIAVVCAEPIGKFSDGLFAARQTKRRQRRKPQKHTRESNNPSGNLLSRLFSPLRKLETKLTTGVCEAGESEGQETQFSETVFHFWSLVLNVVVLAIRAWWGDLTYWVTYLQLVWISTSLVGWQVYRRRSASAIPIIEPGHTLAVFIFGFGGGLLIGGPLATLFHYLVITEWDIELAKTAYVVVLAVGSGFVAWLTVNRLSRRFKALDGSAWLVLVIWFLILWFLGWATGHVVEIFK